MTDSSTYRTNRDLFSNHYLDDHLRDTEPWNNVPDNDVEVAFKKISDLWAEKQERVDDYNEAQLEKNFIRPIFDILGIPFEIEETVMRNARRPDYGFFPSEEAADAAFDRENFYEESTAVADAKRWGRKLDTRGEEKRDFENPSYQIHRYLQETPTQWAVLTNGEKWRLYYGPTSHRLDSYYEIDLPKLLNIVDSDGDLEAFKEFYLFFRQGAFLPDQTGDCFLDDVYDESSVFAEELGEDLQENIYEAIRVLAEGFLDTNDDLDEGDLDLIHDSSLIYLYRLIFVLYAESEGRNLLPTDNEIYSGSYSLNELKQTVVENRDATQQHYQTWQTNLWDRLKELFVLIDEGSHGQGIPKEDLYIPAYNGGLFRTNPDEDDSVESQFLSNYEAGDAYLAEVIELLTRHEADEGKGKVFVDYSSLDERNLGSIYEGLLEYKLDVADEPLTVDDGEYTPAEEDDDITVEEDEVYLRTDDGERKATGSYYTPEYVVEYIVDETLGPLVDEIRQDLMSQSADTTHSREGGFADKFAERIFDLTVLDPAMGSGHFPVNAVDYLAREIIDAQEKQDRQAMDSEDAEVRAPTTEEGELRDINWARRKVAQRCIYGVDVNPLATELAKVSLWLRTLAAEQPLAFLDHHLKTGNSLVGSDIEDVLTDGDDNTTEGGQLTLQQSFDHTRQRAMEHVTDRFQDLLNIDNETLEDAKEMEAVYDDVRDDPLYKRLLAMANVHTADAFGLDIPDDADERMARALHSDAWEKIEQQDWFKSAQAMAEEEHFFHWELEFPMAFYDQNGERKSDTGFDAVIGNPPYVRMEEFKRAKNYLANNYVTHAARSDLYIYFIETSTDILNEGGRYGSIVSNKFLRSNYGKPVRSLLGNKTNIQSIIDFGGLPVFPDATVRSAILISENHSHSDEMLQYAQINRLDFDSLSSEVSEAGYNVSAKDVQGENWRLVRHSVSKIMDKVENLGTSLVDSIDAGQVGRGIVTGLNEAFIIDGDDRDSLIRKDAQNADIIRPLAKGQDIRRYHTHNNEIYLIYTKHGIDISKYPHVEEYLEQYKQKLEGRATEQEWYELQQPQEAYFEFFESNKILYPVIAPETRFALHEEPLYVNDKCFFIPSDDQFLVAVLNSTLSSFYLKQTLAKLEGSSGDDVYYEFRSQYMEKFPVVNPNEGDKARQRAAKLANEMKYYHQYKDQLNLKLLDYLGNYEAGPNLPDIGIFQPTNTEYLDATADDYKKLQIERARTKRDGSSVTIEATARYKPEDEDDFETDTYGYTETEFFEAFTLTNLSEEEATLIEAFVPVAVEEEIGGVRDNATKTNTLIDRLKGMNLPDPDDVTDDLRRYIETKERADELDEKIEKTDQLIDEIVYDLYNLTDEEIEIIEEAVAED
ncbi:Eco57I restriction-modification methylase domain-containing protein [Natrinema gari]|uniref:site-specific DNA-methyltransferase (adenine-specific) n=1 Tax=Natrinema gari JCM 14663 TaxID=1230459 RepID=L9YUU0_9EURY|nr:TaqI-like C-terminal specificity domain-containing protein [Natrinema gari]ELY77252.1 putative restriction/modification enzyme [Natrinema gari JCM 14663]